MMKKNVAALSIMALSAQIAAGQTDLLEGKTGRAEAERLRSALASVLGDL